MIDIIYFVEELAVMLLTQLIMKIYPSLEMNFMTCWANLL